MNNLKRRDFIKTASILALSPTILGGCKNKKMNAEKEQQAASEAFKLKDYGIQLWTVRDDMAKDQKGTLKLLSEYGYSLIESFQHDKLGVFWGMKKEEYKDYLSSLNMKMVSTHTNPQYALDSKLEDEFKKIVDDASAIGV